MRDEVGKFLSTPSARRATSKVEDWEKHMIISIHALREEGDLEAARNGPCLENFYPRPPRGGRPFRFALLYDDITISIHALREEGDARDLAGDNTNTISIHALREEGDPFVTGRSTVLMLFLSTPSARRATEHHFDFLPGNLISIHALLEEGDFSNATNNPGQTDFYPRPPRGGRRLSI